MPSSQQDRLSLVDFLPVRDRPTHRWGQLLWDMRAPAPMSLWSTRVTATRIHDYDRLRPSTTRGFLLAVLAALFALADGTRPLVWAALSVGVLQTVLEVRLDAQAREGTRSRLGVGRRLLRMQDDWQWERTLLNATGVLGGIAVPANVLAVLFLTGPGDPGWAKTAALVTALAYGNSGIIQVLTDGTYYSANQSLPRLLVALRAHGWLLVTAVLVAVVGLSVHLGRWHPDMVPLAWAACAMPYLVGMRMRDYDRFLRAGGVQVERAMNESRARLAQDIHDMFNQVRSLSRSLARDDSVRAAHKVAAADLEPQITMIKEAIDEASWDARHRAITLRGIAGQLARDHSLDMTVDLRLGELSKHNRELTRQLVTTLVANAGQAMALGQVDPRPVSVSARVEEDWIHLVVLDPLPPIAPAKWCAEGSTMAFMRGRLHERDGDMTQHAVPGGKEIRCVWRVRPPRIKRQSER